MISIISFSINNIEISDEKSGLIGLVITKEKTIPFKIPEGSKTIESLSLYRKFLSSPLKTTEELNEFKSTAYFLYNQLFPTPEIKNLIKDKNVLISPDKTNLFDNQNLKKELNIILKYDVQGSSEALKNAINKIEHSEVKPNIILSDIGMINETDISLAKASNAVVIGFNIKPNREAKKSAEMEKIRIEFFNIIYKAIEFVEQSLSGLLEPEKKETIQGTAEILQIFKLSKSGKVAGSKVVEGEIKSTSKARIIRDGVVIHDGNISSIFREKNAVKEVKNGLECGISFKNYGDFKIKDKIEAYKIDIIQREIK